MTFPRELSIRHEGNDMYLTSMPVPELTAIQDLQTKFKHLSVSGDFNLSQKISKPATQYKLYLSTKEIKDFEIRFSNNKGQILRVGYDIKKNRYFINRTLAGDTSFCKGFAGEHHVPRFSETNGLDLTLIIDESSIELFADGGLSVMTEIFFPDPPLADIALFSNSGVLFDKIEYTVLKRIWPK